MQANETVRLFHDKLGIPGVDIEAGKDITATRISAALSRPFLRGDLETKIACIWAVEIRDFLLAPGLAWTKGDVKVDVLAGIFGGGADGPLGQYRDNGFVKIWLTYKF